MEWRNEREKQTRDVNLLCRQKETCGNIKKTKKKEQYTETEKRWMISERDGGRRY